MLRHDRPAEMGEKFYSGYARRYAEVSHLGLQSTYQESEHPRLMSDQNLIERLKELVPPPAKGLDIGCGADARDVVHLSSFGYDVLGTDAVREVIKTAVTLHPELADRVTVADVRNPLDIADESLSFVICNSVIQHIDPQTAEEVVFPSLARVLTPSGVLVLVFKPGRGALSFYDSDFQIARSFILYDEAKVQGSLSNLGLELIPPDNGLPGGLTHFRDGKGVRHVVGFWQKSTEGHAISVTDVLNPDPTEVR